MKKLFFILGLSITLVSCCEVDKKKVSDLYEFKGQKIVIDGESYYIQDQDTIKPKYFLYE